MVESRAIYGSAVDISVLGPLRVTVGDRVVRLPAKQQTLLAVLALQPNATVSNDRLMAALWGEDASPTALKTLQSHVFQLRQVIASIETDGRGYRLRIDSRSVDAGRFVGLLEEARAMPATDARAATAALTQALALWRGPSLPDVGEEPVATAELERLLERRHAAFDELVRLRMSLGEYAEVVPELRRELRESPYQERLWSSLLVALSRSGRRSEALLAYREATEALRRELDVEPGDELQALAASIREGTPDHGGTPPSQPAASAVVGSGSADVRHEAGSASVIDHRPSGRRFPSRVLALGVVVVAGVLILAGTRLLPTFSTSPGPASSTSASSSPNLAVVADSLGAMDSTGRVTADTPLGGQPGAIAVGGGSVWVTSPSDDLVIRVDEATSTVAQRIKVGNAPAGIAFGFGAVWVANSGDRTVSRIDPATNAVVDTISVGTAPDGVAVDDQWVWVTNRLDHSLTRIDPTGGASETFAVGATPLGVAAAAGSVWVADGSASLVAQVDRTTGAVTRTIGVGSGPSAIAGSPRGDAIWVVNAGSGTVFRIDTTTANVTAAQPVGAAPTSVAVDAEGAWVSVSSTDELLQLDPSTAAVVRRFPLAASPQAVALDGGRAIVATTPAAGSHRGGTLRVLTSPNLLPETPDPTYNGDLSIPSMTNDALVTYKRVGGPDGLTIVPDLAVDIPTPGNGGRTWTFRLRPGLTYSTGAPVRASDVLGSFERAVLASNDMTGSGGDFRNTEIVGAAACSATPPCDLSRGITANDAAGTVTFHLTTPDPDFQNAIWAAPILPAGTPLTISKTPLPATGPYVVASFQAGHEERLVRNTRFTEWSKDAQPYGNPAEIDFTISNAPDPSTDAEAGTADVLLVESASPARLAQLRTQVPAQLHVAPSLQTWLEVMNTTIAPFNDVRVRQAVSLATDRQAVLDAWGGPLTGQIACQVLPPEFGGYERYCPWTVDPSPNGNWLGPDLARAHALIAAAGVRGKSVTVWGADDNGQHAAVARYFTGLLDELGFKATTHLLSLDTYFGFLQDTPNRVQMAGYWVVSSSRLPAEPIIGSFACPSLAGASYYGYPSGWCNPTLDKKMQSALDLEATDPIGANQQWAQIDHAIVDAAPAIMAFNPTDLTLLSARVGGYQDHPFLKVMYDQLWVK
jgi:YVTN family beta-propeller protein